MKNILNPQDFFKRKVTPLKIIALFIILAETVSVGLVIKTSGLIQILLTCFVILYPILILIFFFIILWNKNYVFYTPNDFSKGVDVATFVESMSTTYNFDDSAFLSELNHIIHSGITSKEAISDFSKLFSDSKQNNKKEISEILNEISCRTLDNIRKEKLISISSIPIIGNQGIIWLTTWDSRKSLFSLIVNVFIKTNFLLSPFDYGKKWIIKNEVTDAVIAETILDKEWTTNNSKTEMLIKTQKINLLEALIKPGDLLKIEQL